MTRIAATLLAGLLAAAPLCAGEGSVIASMDTLQFKPPKAKGQAVLIEGKVGKAIRFSFEKDAKSTFATSNLRGTPEWDKAAGFSFWVQGDGSDGFGGLQLIFDDDFRVRYDYAFPIKGKDWTKVTVAWQDLIPVLPDPRAKPLGGPDGNPPSRVTAVWFGKWWYWGEYPEYAFAVDEIRLESTIERGVKDYRLSGPPLKRVLDKIEARKPITIVTMGDSLTTFNHWANQKVSWPNLLKDKIKEKHGADVTIVNPAIGGTQLRQNLVLMPRWQATTPAPDLVTVAFGFNDWDEKMRGQEFLAANQDAVDRIRRLTSGKADVLLLTTTPALTRWETMAELSDACRRAAGDRNAGLADTEKAFRAQGRDNRERLFAKDQVHLGPAGHEVVAEAVLRAIEEQGRQKATK